MGIFHEYFSRYFVFLVGIFHGYFQVAHLDHESSYRYPHRALQTKVLAGLLMPLHGRGRPLLLHHSPSEGDHHLRTTPPSKVNTRAQIWRVPYLCCTTVPGPYEKVGQHASAEGYCPRLAFQGLLVGYERILRRFGLGWGASLFEAGALRGLRAASGCRTRASSCPRPARTRVGLRGRLRPGPWT